MYMDFPVNNDVRGRALRIMWQKYFQTKLLCANKIKNKKKTIFNKIWQFCWHDHVEKNQRIKKLTEISKKIFLTESVCREQAPTFKANRKSPKLFPLKVPEDIKVYYPP